MRPTLASQPLLDPLDRHQRRREQSIPTISVLCGPVGLGARRWRVWAVRRGVPVAATSRLGDVLPSWVQSLTSSRDLVADAVGWVARFTRHSPEELRRQFGTMTARDRDWLWRNLFIPPEKKTVGDVCRWLLAEEAGQATPDRLAGRLLQGIEAGPARI